MKKIAVLLLAAVVTLTGCGSTSTTFPTSNQQRISKSSYYDASDTFGGYNTYAYDGNNRLITNAYYDVSSVQQGSTGYAYDGSGRLATESFYDASSVLQSYAAYAYDGSEIGRASCRERV